MTRRILFTIKPDGTVHADASGFKGKICTTDTAKALQGLDAKLLTQTKKAEYVETTKIQQEIRCDDR